MLLSPVSITDAVCTYSSGADKTILIKLACLPILIVADTGSFVVSDAAAEIKIIEKQTIIDRKTAKKILLPII
jgi:hypothetical protein